MWKGEMVISVIDQYVKTLVEKAKALGSNTIYFNSNDFTDWSEENRHISKDLLGYMHIKDYESILADMKHRMMENGTVFFRLLSWEMHNGPPGPGGGKYVARLSFEWVKSKGIGIVNQKE
jgi:predicted neutral ceramidase superfamily lipid hydrolase